MVSTHLKNISQNGNLPQIGVKIKKYLKPPPRLRLFCSTLVFSHPAFFPPPAKSGAGLDSRRERICNLHAPSPSFRGGWMLRGFLKGQRYRHGHGLLAFGFASALDYWFQLWLPPVLFHRTLERSLGLLLWPSSRGDSKWPFHQLVGGHLTPLKGSLNHPKKVTSRIAR